MGLILKKMKKHKIVFLGTIALLAMLFPFCKSYAANLANSITSCLISSVFNLIHSFSELFLEISLTLFRLVLSDKFISWNYTGRAGPNQNPVVHTGWTLARDIMNMFFVIALAFVGLATALEKEEYKIQRLLPRLLFFALLVNFSPVICGVIIDASNILMNYFTGLFTVGEEISILGELEDLSEEMRGGLLSKGACWFNPQQEFKENFRLLLIAFFNGWTGVIFILFSILFMARYVVLWTLVILAPVAFAARIFPKTRDFWEQWWNNFLQWCFIGVTGAFIVFLATKFMNEATAFINAEGVGDPIWKTTLQSLVPLAMTLFFYFYGFTQVLSSSATGAEKVISGTNTAWSGVKTAGGAAAGYVGARAAGVLGGEKQLGGLGRLAAGEGGRETLERVSQGAMGDEFWKKVRDKGPAGRVAASVGSAVGGWAGGKIATAGLQFSDKQRKKIEEEKKKYDEQFESFETALAWGRGNLGGPANVTKTRQRVAFLKHVLDEKGGKGLKKVREAMPGMFNDAIKKMRTYSPDTLKDIAQASPDILTGENEEELRSELRSIQDIDLSKASEEEVEGFTEEVLNKMPETGRVVLGNLVSDGFEDDDVKELMNQGKGMAEALLLAGFEKTTANLRNSDLEDMPNEVLENSFFQDSLVRAHRSPNIVREVAERGGGVGEKMRQRVREMGAYQLKKASPQLLRLIKNSRSYSAVFGEDLPGLEDYSWLNEPENEKLVDEVVNLPSDKLKERIESLPSDVEVVERFEKAIKHRNQVIESGWVPRSQPSEDTEPREENENVYKGPGTT